MEALDSFEGDDNRVEHGNKGIFGEDGNIQPWVLKKFYTFLSTYKPDVDEDLCGNEDISIMEKEIAHKGSSSSEMETECNASSPTSPDKQKGDSQNHFHGGNDENEGKSVLEMETLPTCSEMAHQTIPHSEIETDKVHKKPKEDDEMRKELLLKLMLIAAKKGENILEEASFLHLCSEVIKLEFVDNYQDRIDSAKILGKHVFFSANVFNQSNGVNAGALQREEISKGGDIPTDKDQQTSSKETTGSQRPTDIVPCIMDGHETITRWTKGLSKESSDQEPHIPQNLEKADQTFQNSLEATKVSKHVSQLTQSVGESSLTHSLGQAYSVNKEKESQHGKMTENNKLAKSLQQSAEKQKYGINRNVSTVDEQSKEICASHMEQATTSFAEVLKYGLNSKSSPLSSMLTDEQGDMARSISQALKQSQVLSHSFHATDDSSLFKVEPEVLEKRLNICKFSVVGKLSLGKGERPWIQIKLKEKLQGIWGLKSAWKLISLGRGYFHIILNSQEEWNKVWSRGPLHLKPGVMRFQRWYIGFDPWTEKSSYVQIWLRIYHLPWALWDPSVIAGIARKVGEPLKFDKVTVEGEFGHYARILVDVDLSKPIKPSVHIECGKFMFEVKLVPENLPAYCRGCSSIGHDTKDCWNFFKKNDIAATSKSIGGKERATDSIPPVGTLEKFSADSATTSQNTSMNKHLQATEWRRKKANGKDNAHKEKEVVSSIVESITDFSAQNNSNCSHDAFNGDVAVSNQFSALQTKDDFDTREKEDYKNKQHVDDSVFPKRWSDILDEEEEKEDAPSLDMELPIIETFTHLHPDRGKNPQEEPTRGRGISEIRKGLQQMSQDYAHLLHTPISNKKKKKLKLGIKQAKEPIGSSQS